MPFIGLGIHIVIALFFAVHAIRSGQNLYWLFILFSFPLFGSVAYFFAIYLPNSRLEHGARKAVASAARALDPTRELREAQTAFDYTPTIQNRLRLADALLDCGKTTEASEHFEACLTGPFADDLNLRLGAARASYENREFLKAIGHLEFIRAKDPDFRAEQVTVLLARAFGEVGRFSEAQTEFESAFSRFGSFESKAEYLIWVLSRNDNETAGRLQAEVQRTIDHWNRQTKELNRHLLRRLDAAYDLARKGS